MSRTKALLAVGSIILFSIMVIPIRGGLSAQCYGSLDIPSDYFEYNYVTRVCVHFGDVGDIPEDIQCSIPRPPGETVREVPVYAYNLHAGIEYIEFSIESNDSLTGFTPENGFVREYFGEEAGESYFMDIKLRAAMPVCGPVLLGHVGVVSVEGDETTWVDIIHNRLTGKMYSYDIYGVGHYAFSPHHGGYIGESYLYRCQEPICEEPNTGIADLSADMGNACVVDLSWVAGSGNYTVIRCRTDRYPTGYEDGELVVEMESTPGQKQYFCHSGVRDGAMFYYKAFSLTMSAGGDVEENSLVECSATAEIMVDCQVGVGEKSWGEIKRLYE